MQLKGLSMRTLKCLGRLIVKKTVHCAMPGAVWNACVAAIYNQHDINVTLTITSKEFSWEHLSAVRGEVTHLELSSHQLQALKSKPGLQQFRSKTHVKQVTIVDPSSHHCNL